MLPNQNRGRLPPNTPRNMWICSARITDWAYSDLGRSLLTMAASYEAVIAAHSSISWTKAKHLQGIKTGELVYP